MPMNRDSLSKYNYPDHIINTLKQMMESSLKDTTGRLQRDASVVSMLYNTYNDFPVTPQVFQLMWVWLLKKVRAGHDAWVKQYWSLAVQYYSFKLEHAQNSDLTISQKTYFREFHLMVGTMLLYYKKYDLLKYAFTFTNSMPPKYPLVPGRFQDILEAYIQLSEQNKRMYLLNYSMAEEFTGVGEEMRIEGTLVDFVTLLLVRLESVKDYNITYSDPMELPAFPSDVNIDYLNDRIGRVEFLKGKVQSIEADTIRDCGLNESGSNEALRLLDAYKQVCKDKISELNATHNVSERKRAMLKQSLIETSKKCLPYLPKHTTNDSGVQEEYVVSQTLQLDERLILDKYDYISSNTGEALVNALNTMVQQAYCRQFLYNSAVHSVGVPYPDLAKALERLNLTPDYAILAMGISFFTFKEIKEFDVQSDKIEYKGCRVFEIPANLEQSFIIMRKQDVPTYSISSEPSEVGPAEVEIEAKNHLYSNIDSIVGDNPQLSARKAFILHRPKIMRYVRIRVVARLESDPKILQNIKSIKNYII